MLGVKSIVVRNEPAVKWGRIFDPILTGKWTPAYLERCETDTNSVVDFNISKLSGFTITAGDQSYDVTAGYSILCEELMVITAFYIRKCGQGIHLFRATSNIVMRSRTGLFPRPVSMHVLISAKVFARFCAVLHGLRAHQQTWRQWMLRRIV